MWEAIREHTALDYLRARTQLAGMSRGIISLWETYDVLLTPALAERPVPIGEIDSCSDQPWEDFHRSGRFTPYTALFNVTGQPAISVPLFHGDDGLPTAVQLAGRPAGEATLLSLAAQLETARPWADRRPELATA
jgi:amidase